MNETLEIVDLEQLLEDEPRCEVEHIRTTCSVHVAYRLIWCQGPQLSCAASVEHPTVGTFAMLRAGVVCSGCLKSSEGCWEVIKI